MAVVALLTDFGLSDAYVGVMKGVIFSIAPSAQVVDLAHGVAPQDIVGASYSLYSAHPYFPENTVFTVVVDPGVGSGRRIVALRTDRKIFLAPDNGVLTPVINSETIHEAVSVENPEYFLHPVSRTFHGRDIFAPAAARLAAGEALSQFGPPLSASAFVRLDVAPPEVDSDGCLAGTVIAVDRFGNLITNIGRDDIAAAFGDTADRSLKTIIEGFEINGVSETYQSVPQNDPLVVFGSGDMLEISVNCGDAAGYFKKKRGDSVRVCCL